MNPLHCDVSVSFWDCVTSHCTKGSPPAFKEWCKGYEVLLDCRHLFHLRNCWTPGCSRPPLLQNKGSGAFFSGLIWGWGITCIRKDLCFFFFFFFNAVENVFPFMCKECAADAGGREVKDRALAQRVCLLTHIWLVLIPPPVWEVSSQT